MCLLQSSNSIKAFEQGALVVKGLVDGSIELDETALDAAKSSIVYGVTKSVSTPGRAVCPKSSSINLLTYSLIHSEP